MSGDKSKTTFVYTNEYGVAGRVAVDGVLQGHDKGVRSVQSLTVGVPEGDAEEAGRSEDVSDLPDFLLARYAEDESEFGSERYHADIEAKRQIVEFAADDVTAGWESQDAGVYARTVLGLLALPYADHPDYREEWRP